MHHLLQIEPILSLRKERYSFKISLDSRPNGYLLFQGGGLGKEPPPKPKHATQSQHEAIHVTAFFQSADVENPEKDITRHASFIS